MEQKKEESFLNRGAIADVVSSERSESGPPHGIVFFRLRRSPNSHVSCMSSHWSRLLRSVLQNDYFRVYNAL